MVAAKLLYPDGVFTFPGSQERKVRDFISEMYPVEHIRLKDISPSKLKTLVIVDTKSTKRLGELAHIIEGSGAEVHIYDHHKHEPGDLKGSREVIEPVGATATIFTEILRERGLKPSSIEASILCLGIYEETGNLLYPTTSERDVEAVAWLMRAGASLKVVSTYLRSAMSADEIGLLNSLTESSHQTVINGLKVVTATATSHKYIGDAAHLAHRVMDAGYADAAVIMIEMEGKVIMVGRSRTPEINIATVLSHFGGGGHPTAASATFRETPLSLLEERVIEELKKTVKPGRFAIDVMTYPVISISADTLIQDAEGMLTRYGINALPVTDRKGEYFGIVTREVIEKAIYHELGARTVEEFSSTDALTAERYTPVSVIERRMIERNERFITVVENGKIKGAITRTDLLRAMYDANLRRIGILKAGADQKQSVEKNISSWVCARLHKGVCELLKQAGETAQEMGFTAYLVGGSVRDIVRGRDSGQLIKEPDLDIVIEGDGVAFARVFGKSLDARIHIHDRFHTAKLVTDSIHLDIATARTEYYEAPASLPTVEMSSIKKDLYRRDFTINTLAVKINPGSFGRLVDFFGAQRDIKDRTIKVLHNLSFIEDPTRAFRAVRFAERFDFRLSKHTENLIRSALKMDLFEKLTGSRLYDEMALIFAEKEPTRAIAKLESYGLLKVIHPGMKFEEDMREMLTSVDSTLTWFDLLFTGDKPDRPVIYFSAMLAVLKDKEKMEALKRLTMPDKVSQTVMHASERARHALRQMPIEDPALIREILDSLPLESVLLAMALTKYEDRKREVSRYLTEYRNVSTELKGSDLRELGLKPGPAYSRLLSELLKMRLRGEVSTREDEYSFIRSRMAAGKVD